MRKLKPKGQRKLTPAQAQQLHELLRGGLSDRENLERLTGADLKRRNLDALFLVLDNGCYLMREHPDEPPALRGFVVCRNCGQTICRVPCGRCGKRESNYRLPAKRAGEIADVA